MGFFVAIEKFILAIPFKTYSAAIGAIAYAIYQATQGHYNEAILTILGALGLIGVKSAVTKSTDTIVKATDDQTDHLSRVTTEAFHSVK